VDVGVGIRIVMKWTNFTGCGVWAWLIWFGDGATDILYEPWVP